MTEPNLKDPRKLFYSDGFPQQDQETPALQDKMVPKPDCGEDSYVGNHKLENRRVLITGGDSGIGRAAAIAFACEGADIALHFFPGEEKDAEEVAHYIREAGRKVILLPADLRDKQAPEKLVAQAHEALGGLDTLVLNAAQQISHTKLSDLSMEQVHDTFKVNIISMFETVKAAEKYLKPGSAIITTTSIQSFDPSSHIIDYAATKGAITNFTVALSSIFAKRGIRVNGVAPGPIWTPIQMDQGQPEDAIPNFGKNSPLGRAGQPVELAPVYVLLASDEGSYITGQIYGITGGQPINP